MFFHQGAPRLGEGALRTEAGLAALRAAAAAHLSPAGQLQVATALDMLAAVETRMEVLRAQLRTAARRLTGAKVLAARLYGVGPVTALALTCWLGGAGRFSSSRKAVRFTGLDITVWSSDRKGPPGRLSRQGPPVLRWALYRPARPTPAPRLPTTPATPRSRTARTASALPCPRPARSSGRPATSWPSSATTRSPPPDPSPAPMVTSPVTPRPRPGNAAATLHPMGNHRGRLPRAAVSRCRPCRPQDHADGLIRPSGRIPAGGDTQSIIMSPGQRPRPAHPGKAGCSCPVLPPPRLVTRTERPPLNH